MKPVAWLVGICLVFMGWQMFPSPTWAYYIGAAVLMFAQFLSMAADSSGPMRWVFLYGAFNAATTAGCGALFAAHADGRHMLCDRGSALPVSLLTGLVGIALVLHLVKGRHG